MPRKSFGLTFIHNGKKLCGTDYSPHDPPLDFAKYRWCTIDGCGIVCASSSYLLHTIVLFLVSKVVLRDELFSTSLRVLPNGLRGIYFALYALALVSHWKAMLTNPGAVPINAGAVIEVAARRRHGDVEDDIPQKPKRLCSKCGDTFKPPRAQHDSVTGRCVGKKPLNLHLTLLPPQPDSHPPPPPSFSSS